MKTFSTVGSAIRWGAEYLRDRDVDSPTLQAELLLADLLEMPRLDLSLKKDQDVPDSVCSSYNELIKRRGSGFPLQYLTGEAEFFGRPFSVDERVMIPRPETEVLVERILDRIESTPRQQKGEHRLKICDLGTGSGAILITILLEETGAIGTGVDISEDALEVAQKNAEVHDVASRTCWVQGNLLDENVRKQLMSRGPFDLVVSNPPYVEEHELENLQREVRDHEPELALVSPMEKNHMYSEVSALAEKLLVPGGIFGMETSEYDLDQIPPIVRESGFTGIEQQPDHRGIHRLLLARKQQS